MRKVLTWLAMTLKTLRDKRGWTQAALAKRARVSAGYIARLETHRHDPKLSTLVKLASALEVPVTDLVEAPPAGRGVQSRPIRRSPRRPESFTTRQPPPEKPEGLPPGRGHQPGRGDHPGLSRGR